ncbi:MAG: putative NAD/FAD-dependent oxidoreductase [Porticoccus sp.]|jgi:predicted NAD/FAD-dependent oxidoreductase
MIHIENPAIRKKVKSWIQSGYLSSWSRQSSRFDKTNNSKTIETLCSTPSMKGWHKSVAGHNNGLTGCKVDGPWQLLDGYRQLISTAKKSIITSPPEQAIGLLKDCDGFSYGKKMSYESLHQYLCAIGFKLPLNINADVYRDGYQVLAGAIDENSKPKRAISSPWQEVMVPHSKHYWRLARHQIEAPQHHDTLQMAFVVTSWAVSILVMR